jgi:hypothetical protein
LLAVVVFFREIFMFSSLEFFFFVSLSFSAMGQLFLITEKCFNRLFTGVHCEMLFGGLFYAVQTGMAIDKSSPDCLQYLMALLNTLEQVKKQLAGNEAITSEIVAQAHIEQVAIKLFVHGDNEDRAGRYGKYVHTVSCLQCSSFLNSIY